MLALVNMKTKGPRGIASRFHPDGITAKNIPLGKQGKHRAPVE